MADSSPVQGQHPPVQGAKYDPYDPSQNVLNLVTAAMQRQDDLRERDAAHAKEMRETARMYEERLDAKDRQIRQAETDRINAIRAVDIGAVQRAAEVQATQAQTLATQVATSAETLRTQVQATAEVANQRLGAALEPIIKDIADLRRAQYEAQGSRTQVVEARDTGADTRGAEQMLAAQAQARSARMIGAIGVAVAILSMLLAAYAIAKP